MDGTHNYVMDKIQRVMLVLLAAILSVSFAACSDDKDDKDEPDNATLAGTTWEIISDTDDDDLMEVEITFNKNGNCSFTPSVDGTYAKWTQSDNKLKIVLGEGEPDDYMEGSFVINGSNATDTYSWYDCDGKWGGEDTSVMVLKKK